MSRQVSERAIVFLVAAVQFVNILDFVIVMPLGPFFSASLDIPSSKIGWIASSYTAAAAVSGFAASFFLDRFDRRNALTVAMLGLSFGTAAAGVSQGLTTMMIARMIAGMFGGPATALSLSVISDVIAPARRGRAMGTVMGSFSVASVVGVPLGLKLAAFGGWRLPFFVVAGLALALVLFALPRLPTLRGHLEPGLGQSVSAWTMLKRSLVQRAYWMTAVATASAFIVIPNISNYLVYNLEYSPSALWILYLFGGAASLVGTQLTGRIVDRLGSFPVGTVVTVALLGVLYTAVYSAPPKIPIVAFFVLFMLFMSMRNLASSTLATKVPGPRERARFMSLGSVVQHLSSAASSGFSAFVLTENADKSLVGMPTIAAISMVIALCLPPLLWSVERTVRADAEKSGPQSSATR